MLSICYNIINIKSLQADPTLSAYSARLCAGSHLTVINAILFVTENGCKWPTLAELSMN